MIVIGTLAPGCVSQINKLDPNWDGSYEPECTDNYGAVLGDTLISSALLGIGLAAGSSASTGGSGSNPQASIAALGIGVSLGFAVAAGIGDHEVRDCRRAKQAWQVGQVAASATAAAVAQRDAELGSRPPPPAGVLQPARRGFYCARSTTEDDISLCTRDRVDCDQARDAATLGVADLSQCAAVHTAWCFAGHCYANQASCVRRRGPDGIGACDEIE